MRLWLQGAVAALLLVSVVGASASAQSALEGLAAQRISQETGIPAEFVRALFVDQADGEFVLAFIYINERAVDSNLRPEIKTAITPYVNRNAILVLVVPAEQSFFDPLGISLVQNVFRVSLSSDMLVPITDDFRAGTLEEGQVSAGILTLDTAVLADRPFEIHYAGQSTAFALTPGGQVQTGAVASSPGSGSILGQIGGALRFFLINLLLLFLFPFLVV